MIPCNSSRVLASTAVLPSTFTVYSYSATQCMYVRTYNIVKIKEADRKYLKCHVDGEDALCYIHSVDMYVLQYSGEILHG